MRAWLLAAPCVALWLVPCAAGAASQTAIEVARSAAAMCKGGDAAGAAAALGRLVASLEAELGADSEATQLAEMSLANLEGRRFEPRPSGEGSEALESRAGAGAQGIAGLRGTQRARRAGFGSGGDVRGQPRGGG